MIWAVWALVVMIISGNSQQALGSLWFGVHGDSLNLLQAVIQRYIHPQLWQLLLIPLLLLPVWINAVGAVIISSMLYMLSFLMVSKKRRLFI